MKFFISSDIEGTTGIVHWDEAKLDNEHSKYFREQMTKEVCAACEGLLTAGGKDILVKDAHGTARNINPSGLPEQAKVMRGWTRNPFLMMAGLDETFDGVLFTGYHSAAGTGGNPLAHTINGATNSIVINGRIASEFMVNAMTAAYFGVPVLFLSGDSELCESAKELHPALRTVAVSEGLGNASVALHPAAAIRKIKEEVQNAALSDLAQYKMKLPEHFSVEIDFKEHFMAYRGSFYPGACQKDAKRVTFEADDYLDVLKFLFFIL